MMPHTFSLPPRSKPKIPRELGSFAYKMAWFAIGGTVAPPTLPTIIDAFGITNAGQDAWNSGISRIDDKGNVVLITPPWERWVFVAGRKLFGPLNVQETTRRCKFLVDLSAHPDVSDVQFFASSRSVGAYCWAQAVNGEITRCFAVSPEDGGVVADVGLPLAVENRARLKALAATDEDEEDKVTFLEMGFWADEELVRAVANEWSIDPVRLAQAMDNDAMVTVGLLNHFLPR